MICSKAKHLVDQHRASMLDELTVDRESPLQLAGQAGHLAVCQMLVEAGVLSWGSGTEGAARQRKRPDRTVTTT